MSETKEKKFTKLTSRKFWLTVAMLLGAVATAIAGVSIDNQFVVIVGVICGAAAGCIYNICEAMVDSSYNETILVEDVAEDNGEG